MEKHILENEFLKIEVSEQGAELHSIYNKENSKEYLWQGDSRIWGRRAPVLFPIVGRLFDDTYFVDGKKYSLSQHGFARDKRFDLLMSSATQLTFLLTESEDTLLKYPFNFNLYITYSLDKNKLQVTYEVQNTNNNTMYFSIGGHPAFNTKLFDNDAYENWEVIFENDSYKTYPLNGNFQSGKTEQLVLNNKRLKLNTELFQNDAIIFKNNDIKKVTLVNNNNKASLVFSTDMPNFGIWSPKNTKEFVCLEPWCGIADSTQSTNIKDKEQIYELTVGQIHKSQFQVEIF